MFNIGLPGDFGMDHLNAEHAMLRCPVLALTGGEHDTWSELTPSELQDRLEHIPDVRHHVVEGAGHYLHIEQPDAVLAEVRAFLDQVGP
jgi:pimeloyl-ACP methyl ester carboxylesterase